MRRAVVQRPRRARKIRLATEERKAASNAMIQPDFKTSPRLAQQGNLVPVYETYTADLLTPVGALSAHRARREIFLPARKRRRRRERSRATHSPERIPRKCSARAAATARSKRGGKRVQFEDDPVEQSAPAHHALPSRARAGASAADRRRHRLFRLRHGAAGRAHPGDRPRRRGPRRLRDDVLSRPAGLRSRAAPRLDHSQRVHRRQGQPARKIRRGRARNPAHAQNCSKSRCRRSGARGAAGRCASNPI